MFKRRKHGSIRALLIILLLAVLVYAFGCAPRMVGGDVLRENGIVQQELKAPPSKVHEATISALKDLGLAVKEEEADRTISKITLRVDNGEQMFIEIRPLKAFGLEGTKHDLRPEAGDVSPYATEIRIRARTMGDTSISEELLKRIHEYLSREKKIFFLHTLHPRVVDHGILVVQEGDRT